MVVKEDFQCVFYFGALVFRISSSFTVVQQYISKVFPNAFFKLTFFHAVGTLYFLRIYI